MTRHDKTGPDKTSPFGDRRTDVIQTNAQVQQDIATLCAYIEKQKDGAVLDYVSITRDTGVDMNTHGRGLLRRALQRLRRQATAIRGHGVELSSADNAIDLVHARHAKVGRAFKTAVKATRQIKDRHFEDMKQQDKNALLQVESVHAFVQQAIKTATTAAVRQPIGEKPPAPALPRTLKKSA